MRPGESVFIDTGAFVALALTRDPYHEAGVESWNALIESSARLLTSVPVILETFTFLERNTRRDVALAWKDSLEQIPRFRTLECTRADMGHAWSYFKRAELHKLSAVDATSFALMTRYKIRVAFTFDRHFSIAGFRPVTA